MMDDVTLKTSIEYSAPLDGKKSSQLVMRILSETFPGSMEWYFAEEIVGELFKACREESRDALASHLEWMCKDIGSPDSAQTS